jgi:hypothetical protein
LGTHLPTPELPNLSIANRDHSGLLRHLQ